MEHPISAKTEEVIGFDLERKIVLIRAAPLFRNAVEVVELTDEWAEYLREACLEALAASRGKGNRT